MTLGKRSVGKDAVIRRENIGQKPKTTEIFYEMFPNTVSRPAVFTLSGKLLKMHIFQPPRTAESKTPGGPRNLCPHAF